ncbi:phytoene desaturase family protein [Streptomyces sp. NEAU-W12]|uniref:phytoene desaturase family protein n=1 Tax=Streptomyces sp. NEAU-W12 TaxID=2994668 RepID=UPI00224AA202|nr:NAD(P)/FAD-dependent oxidoreductase [Streptomyces sp. NEAU-W12]MCX2922539.1 NAD(P)/FAD-dependent oxidoreductase [Streptomyces sp. NEAU-W12]
MARIAVVGAGLGAMAAAARLAVAGHRVAVYERTDTYGGALRRLEREGFVFDTGPGLLPLPAVYRDLFLKTGKEPLESCVELVQVDPSSEHVFADGTRLPLPNASRAGVVSALDAALGPAAARRWGDFLVRAREAWDRTRRPLLEEPLWPNWQVLADREPYPAVPHRKLLRTRTAGTLAEVAAWELRDPRLASLLESHAIEHGLDPRSTPASAAVLPYMEHAFGTWYVRGGMRELARAVYERCLARGVEFRFGAEVTGVLEKDGRAAGVEFAEDVSRVSGATAGDGGRGGAVAEADRVIAGVTPGVLDRLTRGARVRGDGEVPGRSGAASRLTVLLALRGGRPEGTAHRTVVHTLDRGSELASLFGSPAGLPAHPTVTVLRPDDPALVPDADHEAVTLTSAVPAGSAGPALDEHARNMIAAAERAVPGLRDRLLYSEVRTPDDVARTTGAEGGAVPVPALAAAGGRLLHPSNSTGVPGLLTVGGWSHPGGGLPHAGMSGALVAGLIVEGPEFRGSQ